VRHVMKIRGWHPVPGATVSAILAGSSPAGRPVRPQGPADCDAGSVTTTWLASSVPACRPAIRQPTGRRCG
jgi:hypothetical protein